MRDFLVWHALPMAGVVYVTFRVVHRRNPLPRLEVLLVALLMLLIGTAVFWTAFGLTQWVHLLAFAATVIAPIILSTYVSGAMVRRGETSVSIAAVGLFSGLLLAALTPFLAVYSACMIGQDCL